MPYRIVNGEVCSDEVPRSRLNSTATTPQLTSTPSLTAMPSLTLGSTAPTPSSQAGTPLPTSRRLTPLAADTASHSSPPPLTLSAQYTNPYLSHTTYGGSLTSGAGYSPSDDAQAQQAAQHQAALAAAYYPYHLYGFSGPGFILGHAQHAHQQSLAGYPQQQQQQLGHEQQPPTDASNTSPPPPNSLPVLSVTAPSSSCPSPLLTSTSERRRSKPHVQYIPPTHAVTPSGLVVPVLPPPASTAALSSSLAKRPRSTSARVSHAFNLFGLPPVFVYEIRVPPHVYLLTGLILYAIGPPALVPLVAAFFFYRWHLQRHGGATASNDRTNNGSIGANVDVVKSWSSMAPHSLGGAPGHSLSPHGLPPSHPPSSSPHVTFAKGHPPGLPKVPLSPLLTQRRHPNVHTLADLPPVQ